MKELYPLKFETICKERIWAGDSLKKLYPAKNIDISNCGETWEISAVQDSISVVSNGFLKGNTLQDIIEIYMDELVGETVFDSFGIEFPLLIKFIDTSDLLSIQVHPNDEVSKKRHNAFGKTEMWYVVQSAQDSELIVGFNKTVSKDTFVEKLENNKLSEILNSEKVKKGDVYYLPAGRIHAIGKNLVIAEIQQTSDITYRIFDWNRFDKNGNPRELHLELALDVIDYEKKDNYKSAYNSIANQSSELVSCKYFKTNILNFDTIIKKDYSILDSFIIFITLEGGFSIQYGEDNQKVEVVAGETVLLPASLRNIQLTPIGKCSLLEVYID
ncbi:MAG: class I mannose-6-phosphate isomerase [Bacteroidales bacterium]|nr:class I mannose-6-phosphate isomerase [Bacteroidales bacterium]